MWEQKKVNQIPVYDPNQAMAQPPANYYQQPGYPAPQFVQQPTYQPPMGPPPPYQPPQSFYPPINHEYKPSYPSGLSGQPMNPGQSMPGPYPSASYGAQYQYNPYPQIPPNACVVMPQAFDAGARFDGIAKPNIPPPPPGIAPNPAQMASMQGNNNVVVGQKKDSWLAGGSSGGYTFW